MVVRLMSSITSGLATVIFNPQTKRYLMDKIVKKIIKKGNCLIWKGCTNTDGYPKITRNRDSNIKGHRYVYEQTKGEIPEGFVVRHTCDNILCLNPDHLIVGTMGDNMRDRRDRGRTDNHVNDSINEQIDALLSGGYSQMAIAKMLKVSQGHVSKISRDAYKYRN